MYFSIFSGDEKKIIFTTNDTPIYRHSFTADYWVYDIVTRVMKPLSTNGAQEVATFSPDGTKVAFVRGNNLFWVDLASGKETQITTDGKFNFILNGKPDWVYEEEYGFAQAYQWAPDSQSIAYWKTDESRVKEYHMNFFQKQLYPTVYSFKYPKAGEQNSIVSIHTVNLATGVTKEMNIGEETDIYVPRIKWTNDSRNVLVFRLNRLQNNFDMLQCNAVTGENSIVYNQKDKRYINRLEDQTVMFLSDGDRYIIQSEKDGYNHLYLYSLSKGFIRQITKGGWEVTELLGVDGNTVYYMSAETSPVIRNLYSINLKGSNKKRITKGEGNYTINFNNDFSYFISYFTNATTPNTVTLHTADGKQVRVLENNTELKAKIQEYKLPVKEFFSFTTAEGVSLNGYMMRPSNFDLKKKYPVFMTQYSGPGSQQVLDRWTMEWEHCLVQDGYILVCVDGRGT
ncbi:MAG: DPP IV N-terminal domain-containing protein, partial [Rikenellaceae bacterium]